MPYNKRALKLHKQYRGKIETRVKVPLKTNSDLAAAYTPGVGAVVREIYKNKKKSWELTNRGNTVAIVSDGSAVLGLGNIGAEAALPVMEGKAAIFKEFAGVDAVPLCIGTANTEEIIKFCKFIEPSFGGINLEDIAAPACFKILKQLEKELAIPVFHDDQDGTAIVVLAALINACRISGRVIKELKIIISGAGAAGTAIARILLSQGINDIILVDSRGIIYDGRSNLGSVKQEMARITNKKKIKGDLARAMVGADVFIGVSKGGIVKAKMVKKMNKESIILAMANPIPEIMPAVALKSGAFIVGTGRSDFPNQINNALVFPGIFRGLFDSRIKKITEKIKISSAIAIAYSVKPSRNKILPSLTDKKVVKAVAQAIKNVGKHKSYKL